MNKLRNALMDGFNYIEDKLNEINKNVIFEKINKFLSKGNRKFVVLLYILALCVFGFTLFTNYFTIPVSGDFKLQEIPFYYNGYDDWWTALTTGHFPLWDDNTYLGANNIGSNTFYYLWNIFFLPVLLLPRALVPQGQAFLIMTKFVLAGLVMKKLLNYMGVKEDSSKIVGIAYAFSGWGLYYLWFNHFLEVAVLFPLVIYGLEILFKEKKTRYLIVALFISAMTNYFFFIMTCFCSVIYAVFRYFQLWKTYTGKERGLILGLGLACYVTAMCLSALILFPAFHVALQSSRSGGEGGYLDTLLSLYKQFFSYLTSGQGSLANDTMKEILKNMFTFQGSSATKYYMYPVISYLFPPVSCYDSTLFVNSGYDNTNCSLFLYTPLTLMVIPSLIQSIKEKRVSHIIGFIGILLMIFSPFFYYCFTGFTTVMYGRWQLFVVVAMAIYVGISLDKINEMKRWYFDISAVCIIGLQIFMFIKALEYQGTMSSNTLDERKYYAIITMIYTFLMYLYLNFRCKKKRFKKGLTFAVALEAIVVGNVLVQGQGTVDYASLYGGYDSTQSEIRMINNIKNEDKTYYRIYSSSADRDANNLGMVESYRGLGAFHSIYNYETTDFNNWSRICYSRDGWSMGAHEKRANLDTFLGVKYYIVNANDSRLNRGKGNIITLKDNLFYTGDVATNIEALPYTSITNNDDYIIYSIDVKENSSDYDIYVVKFINSKGDIKSYDLKLLNDVNRDLITISIVDNKWAFNGVTFALPAYQGVLTSTNYKYITTLQKLDDGKAYNAVFNDGTSVQVITSYYEDKNIPFGYKEIARDDINVLYENENFVNLGFAFNDMYYATNISTSDSYSGGTYRGTVIQNEYAYVHGAILDNESIDEITSKYPDTFNKYVLVTQNTNFSNDVTVVNVPNNNIDVYVQNWNHEQGIALDYASPVKYPASSSPIYWNSYMDIDVKSLNVASEAKTRGGAYVTVCGRMGENLMITLYGEDDNGNEVELASDIHMTHNYGGKSYDWKNDRGFYVNDQVTRIIVRAYDTFESGTHFAKPNITYQYYDSYKANIDTLKENELQNVEIGVNDVTFDTNYSQTKMVVLTIPYDEGWSLSKKDSNGTYSDVKLYKAQGGFLSFVAEEGNYSYTLKYVTPQLTNGMIGFGIGLLFFGALYIGMDVIYQDKITIKKQLNLKA